MAVQWRYRCMNGLGLMACLAAIIAPFHVAAFERDMTAQEYQEALDNLTVGSLAVGERGLVSHYGLIGVCTRAGEVVVPGDLELWDEADGYSVALDFVRLPNDEIEITVSKANKFDKVREILSDVGRWLSAAPECGTSSPKREMLKIKTIFGAETLSGLASSLGSPEPSQASTEKQTKPAGDSAEGSSGTLRSTWRVSEGKSPVDDSPTVVLALDATDGGERVVFRCNENKTHAYVVADSYLGYEKDAVRVVLRFDDGEAKTVQADKSTDRKAFFLRKPIGVIKRMNEARRMVVRYWGRRGERSTAVFDVGELSTHLPKLRAACNW